MAGRMQYVCVRPACFSHFFLLFSPIVRAFAPALFSLSPFIRTPYMMQPLRLSLLSLFALSCSSAVSQSVRYDATGGALFFSPAPDSSSCSLSRVEFKSAASVSLCVPEFVHNGNRKLSVSSLGGGDEPLCRQVQALREVSIPRSVKNVEPLSFSVCPNLSKVTSYAPYPPALGRGAFLKGRYLGEVDTLVVPASAVERYKSSSWGKSFSTFLPLYTFTNKKHDE